MILPWGSYDPSSGETYGSSLSGAADPQLLQKLLLIIGQESAELEGAFYDAAFCYPRRRCSLADRGSWLH